MVVPLRGMDDPGGSPPWDRPGGYAEPSRPRVKSQVPKPASPELKQALLEVLARHRGRVNRIARRQLLAEVRARVDAAVSDRAMRAAIEELRERHGICSSSSFGGYWLPDGVEEIDRTIAEFKSRMASFHGTVSSLEVARDHYVAQPLEQGHLL